MSTLEQKLEELKTGFAASLPSGEGSPIVTREFKNHAELNHSDLLPGRWTLVAGAGQGFDQSRDLDESLRGGRHTVALIYQTVVPEDHTTEQVEQKVNTAFEQLKKHLKSGSCCLYLSSYNRCTQLDHPYGWLAANLYFSE